MSAPHRFVILGGGTAGWMAACLIARHCGHRAAVTLVESPEIGIIGVGEGSTPQLKAFFDQLGVAESEWMPRCNATYKTGIRFHGWSNQPGFESYFHPFPTELDVHTAPAFFRQTQARRAGRDVFAHPDRFFLPARLAAEKLAPLPAGNFPFEVSYGYHFDSQLVGQFLQEHATMRLGVTHRQRRVVGARQDAVGNLTALTCQDGADIPGDFFIDASGFRGTLVQKTLGEPFESFAGNLFNDAAVAVPTEPTGAPTPCETGAIALSSGWAWRIPLTNRVGNGYVYSAAFQDADAAETELRAHLGLLDAEAPVRHLKMKVGQVRRSWVRNALAIGLAQGFIEPLEATALHIVHATVGRFIDAYLGDAFRPDGRDAFNTAIHARYEGIRDYIVCHYRMNRRDGEYWRANAANADLSDNLKAVVTAWFKGEELDRTVRELGIERYYAAASWHCLFAGYGQFPARLIAPEPDLPVSDMDRIDRFLAGCAANFPPHDAALHRPNAA